MKYQILILLLLNISQVAFSQEAKAKKFVYKDSVITIRLSRNTFEYYRQNNIDISAKASKLLESSRKVPTDSNKLKVVSKRITEDDGFEVTYSDGSKKISYKNGFTMITPDGIAKKYSFMQVSSYVPPSPPNDPNEIKYLQNLSISLLSLLSDLLNNDAASISNFKLGDANLDLYQAINRRLRFIDYVNSKK